MFNENISKLCFITEMVETLKALGYKNPTPIQELVIPKALKGESLLATSETGSGKTHAF